MSINEKKDIVTNYNIKNHSFFNYDKNTDTVNEEFNVKSIPVLFDEWYKNIKNKDY